MSLPKFRKRITRTHVKFTGYHYARNEVLHNEADITGRIGIRDIEKLIDIGCREKGNRLISIDEVTYYRDEYEIDIPSFIQNSTKVTSEISNTLTYEDISKILY